MTFETLGLSEQLLRAVRHTGYTTPTPIQVRAIPPILKGRDIMAAAQTGTGKTAGFCLPMLQRLTGGAAPDRKGVRALVLTPTRELAAQVQEDLLTYGKYLKFTTAVVFGGVNINPQIQKLRNGVDILVATPGRLLDLHGQKAVRLDKIEIFVLDEADRMLDMGFIPDIKRIMSLLPGQRQNLMFSATFSTAIRDLAKRLSNDPVEIDVAPRNSTIETITQVVHPVDKSRKTELLSHLVRTENWFQVLVFSRTKRGADNLVKKLTRDGIQAAAIHGNKSQAQRTRIMNEFKRNRIHLLVATDIASRGIDVDTLTHVVNFDLPYTPEDYIHRIGRTGRAGASGHAVSLVSADEAAQLRDIERLIQSRIERREVINFEPAQLLSENAGKPAHSKQRANKPRRRSFSRGGRQGSNPRLAA